MGKGDKKTKKGKITSGSYGVTRMKKSANAVVVKPKPKAKKVEEVVEEAAPKKVATKKTAAAKKPAAKKAPAKKKTEEK